jgi:hypothetical protein
MISEELDFFYSVLSTIKSYLGDFIIIGGFSCLLYQFHERARSVLPSYLITYDVDVAAGSRVPIRGGKLVHQLLLEAGLREQLSGSLNPPVAKYFLGNREPSLYYVEFLTPLSGSENKRSGEPDGTRLIQAELSAQKLRYLDLLFKDPWLVDTVSIRGLEKQPSLVLRIPHPNMFIMQKILISRRRPPQLRRKDFAYVYMALTPFRRDLECLAHEYEGLINNKLWRKWYADFIRLSREIFGTPDSEGPIEGSKVLDKVAPSMISPAVMRFINNCPTI